MVSQPPDVGSGSGAVATPPTSTGAPSTPSMASALGTPPVTQQGAAPAGALAAALDRADIRPLDVPGALQILIAEVQLSLVEALSGASAPGRNGVLPVGGADAASAFVANAAQENLHGAVAAARVIVGLVLQSLPETFEPGSWSIALPRVDAALQAGVQSAIQAVAAWRDVPPTVVDATRQAGTLALNLIAEEPPYPLWPPPEWVGMAPRLGRLWRRRRVLKRRLLDPDHGSVVEHETSGKRDDLDDVG